MPKIVDLRFGCVFSTHALFCMFRSELINKPNQIHSEDSSAPLHRREIYTRLEGDAENATFW